MACNEYSLCKNAYYEAQPNKFIIIKCKLNSDICLYSRYCNSLLKVVHTSSYTQCVGGRVNHE